jgi:hypothetical protein
MRIESIRLGGKVRLKTCRSTDLRTVVGIDKRRNKVVVASKNGVLWSEKEIKQEKSGGSIVFKTADFDFSYFPCKILIYTMESVAEYYWESLVLTNDVLKIGDGKKKKDNMTDFFFPKDKLNPKRDPNSPWEFL